MCVCVYVENPCELEATTEEIQFLYMTLKIRITNQREPLQADFPFEDQTSHLVTDRTEPLATCSWVAGSEIHKPGMSTVL